MAHTMSLFLLTQVQLGRWNGEVLWWSTKLGKPKKLGFFFIILIHNCFIWRVKKVKYLAQVNPKLMFNRHCNWRLCFMCAFDRGDLGVMWFCRSFVLRFFFRKRILMNHNKMFSLKQSPYWLVCLEVEKVENRRWRAALWLESEKKRV